MFDRSRPIWQSILLHTVLVAGAVVFALPYAWLAGTSWKLDKEVQSEEIRILPARPIPSPASPWIDPQTFPPIERPEYVSAERWEWIQPLVRGRIDRLIRPAARELTIPSHPEIAAKLERARGDAVQELEEGVFRRLLSLVPREQWTGRPEPELAAALDKVLAPELAADCFEQCYRYFALGGMRLVTSDYRVVNLPGKWQAESGRAWLDADGSNTLVRYDLSGAGTLRLAAECSTRVDLGDPRSGFKRVELGYRGDLTWHDLRVCVEMNGRRWRTESPKYLATDQWSEILVQLPGEDDRRLIPHRYIRLADTGPSDLAAPGRLRITVELDRSNQPEALWAKGTENYRKAFEEVPFWRYFKTSAFLVAANIIGTLLSCSLVAYAFARLHWPGRDLCFTLVLATLMIPPQVTMIPSFVIYKYLGWYNSLAPLWVPNLLAVNGFAIFLLRQAMKGIPRDLEEAAKIDGCSHLRIWWHIMLPLVRPTMAAIAIFTFMFVWNDFMTPLIYVNDQRLYPLALGLFSFMAGRENQFTLIMAGSMIMTLPVILTFFFAQRYFIQGVAMSGMKN